MIKYKTRHHYFVKLQYSTYHEHHGQPNKSKANVEYTQSITTHAMLFKKEGVLDPADGMARAVVLRPPRSFFVIVITVISRNKYLSD